MESVVVIKSGTLDDPSWISPRFEIYADAAHPWVHAADAPDRKRFPRALEF